MVEEMDLAQSQPDKRAFPGKEVLSDVSSC